MSETRIVKISVNDPDANDKYNLVVKGRQYNLVALLFELESDEHLYLLDALDQARQLQRQDADEVEDAIEDAREEK